jgi:hypothetical protein
VGHRHRHDALDAPGARLHHHHPVAQYGSSTSWVTMTMVIFPRQMRSSLLQVGAGEGVEGAEGLVEQQDARPVTSRGRSPRAGHAARELVRVGLPKPDRSAMCSAIAAAFRGLGLFSRARPMFCSTVSQGTGVVLEHDAALQPGARHRLAVEQDAAVEAALQADQQAQQVDLPQPLLPTMLTNSPGAMSRLMSSSTGRAWPSTW